MYLPDLAADGRWRDHGLRAAARGAASCASIPVAVDGRMVAVFKVHSAQVDGLVGRPVIDLALGMLMERHHCGADAAFNLLRRYSQHDNVRLRDAAAQVVGDGDAVAGTPAPFTPGRSG